MMSIKKIAIGIRPSSRMFRIPSVIGLIIDTILSERGGKKLPDEYYSEISSNHEKASYRLRNETLGNTLIIDMEHILFVKNYYTIKKHSDIKDVFSEFSCIWQTVNEYLKVKDIRRLGIVSEHQFIVDNTNKKLLDSLTCFQDVKHPAKFRLNFENRHQTAEGLAPDIERSDFLNVIYDIYDGELDVEHPQKGTVNANLDVQRYFSPLIKSNIPEEVAKLHKIFLKEQAKFESFLKDRELLP